MIIIIQRNSIQWFLAMCRLNITSANYNVSTRTQTQHKAVQIHKNKTLTDKTKPILRKVSNTKVLGQTPL
jgi:hypothetical protein